MNLKNTKFILDPWFVVFCSSTVFGLAVPLVANAAMDRQEGEWKTVIGMAIETPDFPFAMPSVKFMTNTCLTQNDVLPNTAQKNQKCETTDYKVAGSMAIWTSSCVDINSITEGRGEIVFKNKTYQGIMHMTRTPRYPGARPVTMSYTLNGNYVGACERDNAGKKPGIVSTQPSL